MLAFLTGVAYSQTDSTKTHKMSKEKMMSKYDQNVKDAASKLQTQVNLTAEQTRRVEGILQNYEVTSRSESSNSSGNNMSSTNNSTLNKIEKVLKSDQKIKFDQIKDQWWSETQSNLNMNKTDKTSTDKTKSGY